VAGVSTLRYSTVGSGHMTVRKSRRVQQEKKDESKTGVHGEKESTRPPFPRQQILTQTYQVYLIFFGAGSLR
jgi:hypothetical protein